MNAGWRSIAITAALTQLLAGPTRAERDAGYRSVFTEATAGMLRSVRVTRQVHQRPRTYLTV